MSQSIRRDRNEIRVNGESSGNHAGQEHPEQTSDCAHQRTGCCGEPESVLQTIDFAGTIVVSDDRLHALAYAYHHHHKQRSVCGADTGGRHCVVATVQKQSLIDDDIDSAPGEIHEAWGKKKARPASIFRASLS